RQLEKAILIRLKIAAEDDTTDTVVQLEKLFIRSLSEMGRAARIADLADKLYGKTTNQQERAHVAFIATLAPSLTVIDENDNYHQATAVAEYGDEKHLKGRVDEIVKLIKEAKEPQTVDQLFDKLRYEHPAQVAALASISKQLAHLRDSWGLTKWPTVNPKNIRDKIYVILADNKKPMHFSDIAKSIKDKRFVLIGRGIYALDNWGYSKGTVSDIISDVLRKAGEPLHRDEIVKRVLKSRQVKETTILLNLQSKSQFKRVAKATYILADEV
ncbi:hypothetical protein B7Z28_01165, partial [Candidatus Saccharibacteria bacterium 32-45-3]